MLLLKHGSLNAGAVHLSVHVLQRARAGMSDFKNCRAPTLEMPSQCGGKPVVRRMDAEEASPWAKAEPRSIVTKVTAAAASNYRALIYARHCVRTLYLSLSY